MNCKTLKELCGEAGLECAPYQCVAKQQLGDKLCFAIMTGDAFNTAFDLLQVLLEAPLQNSEDPNSYVERDGVISDLMKTLRSPKQWHDGMTIVLYWPAIPWEE